METNLKENIKTPVNAWTYVQNSQSPFFTLQTVGSFAVFSVVIGFLYAKIEWANDTQQLVICSLITFGLMFAYSLLTLDWPIVKQKFLTVVIQFFLSIVNSLYVMAIVTGFISP
jgi:hypothetical protein